MSEHELRRRLAEAIPEPAFSPDRADAARRRARGRRNRLVAVASTVAVAVAIGIPVAISQDSQHRVEPAPAGQELACPTQATDSAAQNLAASGASTLEPGATRARLCYVGGMPWQPPADELDSHVDELVSFVNHAPVRDPSVPMGCPLNLGPTRGLVFGYPDGSTRFVTAAAYGCYAITVGGVTRGNWNDVEELMNRFVTLLRAQRGDREPVEAVKVPLSCDRYEISLFGNDPPPALTKAILCWRRTTNSDQPVRTAPISADDLRVLMSDMAARATPGRVDRGSCGPQSVDLRIIGSNAWGDRFAIYGDCGGFELTDGPHSTFWKPGPTSQAILDNLVAAQDEPMVLPDSDTPPDQVVARWSDLVVARDPRADTLWSGQVPDVDATKLQLKVDAVRKTTVPGGQPAYEVDALFSDSEVGGCPVYREVTFRLGREHPDDPWKILSWTDHGHESGGC